MAEHLNWPGVTWLIEVRAPILIIRNKVMHCIKGLGWPVTKIGLFYPIATTSYPCYGIKNGVGQKQFLHLLQPGRHIDPKNAGVW